MANRVWRPFAVGKAMRNTRSFTLLTMKRCRQIKIRKRNVCPSRLVIFGVNTKPSFGKVARHTANVLLAVTEFENAGLKLWRYSQFTLIKTHRRI